jgi:methyltransferase-like protein
MIDYPKVDDKIVFREEGEEAFLFHPDTGNIKVLNSTGTFIWKLCDGKHSKEKIINKIVENFAVDSKDTAAKDLEEILKDLTNSNFILKV